jgi:hypothetical protein
VGDVTDPLDRRQSSMWRISLRSDVYGLLWTIRPYLTWTRAQVGRALDALAQLADDDDRRRQRDRDMVALWLKGDRSKNAIAQEYGVSYAVVTEVIARYQRGLEPPAEAG